MIDILHEDADCLAVAKPVGLPTQAPPGIDSLEVRIKDYLRSRGAGDEEPYLGVPHRLDRPASGAMIFAPNRLAARRISRQFERRQVRKVYWACVAGQVEPPAGTWRDFLWKVYGHPRAEVVEPSHPGAVEAVLHYRTLGKHRFGSWLEIALETGRTHQVRVQAASRGYPLLGDVLYGSQIPFGPPHDDLRLRAIALHARSLSITHPTTRVPLEIVAPVPEMWEELQLVLSK